VYTLRKCEGRERGSEVEFMSINNSGSCNISNKTRMLSCYKSKRVIYTRHILPGPEHQVQDVDLGTKYKMHKNCMYRKSMCKQSFGGDSSKPNIHR